MSFHLGIKTIDIERYRVKIIVNSYYLVVVMVAGGAAVASGGGGGGVCNFYPLLWIIYFLYFHGYSYLIGIGI